MKPTATPAIEQALLTKVEAAKRLRVSVRTLDRLAIPRVPIRGKILYRLESLDQFILSNEQPVAASNR